MTTLLGFWDPASKRGYLAADGQSVSGRERISASTRKIFRADDWLVGSSGEHLMTAMLDRSREKISKAADVWEVTRILKAALAAEGVEGARDEDGGANRFPGDFLVVTPWGCFTVSKDLTPIRQDRPCNTGSGGAYAAGALQALLWQGVKPEDAMRMAIEVAIHFDTGSGGEIQVEATE